MNTSRLMNQNVRQIRPPLTFFCIKYSTTRKKSQQTRLFFSFLSRDDFIEPRPGSVSACRLIQT